MLARCYLRRLAGGDNLRKEHRTQVSREQVRVYLQGDRRVKVPQLAGDWDDRGAVRDQQGRTGMPDLMGGARLESGRLQQLPPGSCSGAVQKRGTPRQRPLASLCRTAGSSAGSDEP